MNDVTPVNVFTAPVQVVQDGDAVDGGNTLVTVQALVNRDTNLNARLAAIEAALGLDSHKTALIAGDSGATRETITATAGATNKGAIKGTGNGSGFGVFGQGGLTGAGVEALSDGATVVAAATKLGAHVSGVGTGASSTQDALQVDQNVRLAGANPAAATGFLNRLTPLNLPKAWGFAKLNGSGGFTASDGFNGSWSVVGSGGAKYLRFTFATAMADTNYAVPTTGPIAGGASTWFTVAGNKTTAQFDIQVYDNASNLISADDAAMTNSQFNFTVFGRQ